MNKASGFTTANSVDGDVGTDKAVEVAFSPVLSSGLFLDGEVESVEEGCSCLEPRLVVIQVDTSEVISTRISDNNILIRVCVMDGHLALWKLRRHVVHSLSF